MRLSRHELGRPHLQLDPSKRLFQLAQVRALVYSVQLGTAREKNRPGRGVRTGFN
jgi:hypothetical protein